MTRNRQYWDVDIDTTRIGLERLGRGLIRTGSQLTDSLVIGDHRYGRGVSAFLRVNIPVGKEQEFDQIVQPITRKPPSKAGIV